MEFGNFFFLFHFNCGDVEISLLQVYKHLQRAIVSTPGVFERPEWWREVTYKDYIKKAKM